MPLPSAARSNLLLILPACLSVCAACRPSLEKRPPSPNNLPWYSPEGSPCIVASEPKELTEPLPATCMASEKPIPPTIPPVGLDTSDSSPYPAGKESEEMEPKI